MHKSPLSTQQIKAEAQRLGFSACGFARAEAVDPTSAADYRRWIAEGKHADMNYMADHADKRMDPRLLLEGTHTIVSLALNYYPIRRLSPSQYQFAYYAYGHDYHDVMKQRLRQLAQFVQTTHPHIGVKICVDTAPVHERYWAWKAGLGWIGRNHCLIIPHHGSYFFLGELLLTATADHYDQPLPSHCGNCRQCILSCPTHALTDDRLLNAAQCLSYLTIEYKGNHIAAPRQTHDNTYIYGCDRCQRTCPHNRFAQPTTIADFHPSDHFMAMQKADWQQLTRDDYQQLFRGSAVKRAKYEGLLRNIRQLGKD